MDNEKYIKSVRPKEVHVAFEAVWKSPRLHEYCEYEIADAGDDCWPELVEQQHYETGLKTIKIIQLKLVL